MKNTEQGDEHIRMLEETISELKEEVNLCRIEIDILRMEMKEWSEHGKTLLSRVLCQEVYGYRTEGESIERDAIWTHCIHSTTL
jgi:hypothetical protein